MILLSTVSMAQRVMIDNYEQLKVHFETPNVVVDGKGDYLLLSAEGYIPGGEVGSPMLPVCNNLLTVPFCDNMVVEVSNAFYDTISLPQGRVMPLQPARSKSDRGTPQVIIDQRVYATDAFVSRPLASVNALGIGRDRRYAVLSWSPVAVNPVSGQMVVCRSADVTVRYQGADAGATLKHLDRYYTPAFSLGTTLNTLFSDKDVRATAPVRMVVMAPQRLQCAALDEFVDWKRLQGMLVELVYVSNNASASDNAAILQQMFDEASITAPAPTYLVLVGDNEQLRAFDCNLPASNVMHSSNYQLDDHVTDLYFVTWTPDMLPDCYQGRFSATDTATVRSIVEKTIYYERYRFLSDSYLARAALISGVDNGYGNDYYDNAWRCSDPTMDYVASIYVNAANGFDSVVYYKNNVNQVPPGVTVTGNCNTSQATNSLRAYYNTGVGWINYSAHGDWDGWYKPSFSVSHVNNTLRNTNMPSFVIGNCCLTNHFNSATCFGEALLRKGNNAGAVCYIGATNSTFWDHDFYWSVGVRSGIRNSMSLYYDASRRGMYDNLFHTHNEALSQWMVTAGKMLFMGNMSVNSIAGTSSSASDFVDYYWEIYELMGDPSLMPWLGRAEDLTAPAIVVDHAQVSIQTVPGAYVALVDRTDRSLVAAGFADANGELEMTVEADRRNNSFVSITAQGYKPYLAAFSNHNVGIGDAVASGVTVCPNPATDRVEVTADGLREVTMLNLMGQTLNTHRATADRCDISVSGIPAGVYLLRIKTEGETSVRKLIVR